MKVAAAQIESIPGDLDRNLRKHLDVVNGARAGGVDLLLFPELSLCGHGGGVRASRLAIDRDDPHLIALAAAAGPMATMTGAVEKSAGGTFCNALFALRDGSVVHVHRKVHLATYGRLDDGAWFAPGNRIETFPLRPGAGNDPSRAAGRDRDDPSPASHDGDETGSAGEWRIAPMICADTWNPPLVHLAAAQGATVMAVAVSSALEAVGDGFDNPAGWDVNLRFHALTYGLPIVMANRVGIENGLTFWGGSRILDASGQVLASATPRDRETLVTAVLDLRDVERARRRLPTMRDASSVLLAHEFARVSHPV